MRKLFVAIALLASACNGGSCSTVPVGLLRGYNLLPFKSMVSGPTINTFTTSTAWTLADAQPIPPDVTSVKVRMLSLLYSDGTTAAGHGGADFTSSVAVCPSAATTPPSCAVAPTPFNQTIKADGTETVSAVVPITRGTDGRVVVSYTIPTGKVMFYNDEGATGLGWYMNNTSAASAYPLPTMTSNEYVMMTVRLEYDTIAKRVIQVGDSLSEGKLVARESRWGTLLQTSGGYAVDDTGLQGSTLVDWTNGSKLWLRSLQVYGGATAVIELGTNDSIGSLPLAGMESNFQTLVSYLQGQGVTRIVALTIAPGASNNCTRSTDFNTWLLAGVSGVYAVVDTVPLLRSVGDPCLLDPSMKTADNEHWTALANSTVYTAVVAQLP